MQNLDKAIQELINKTSDVVTENANKDHDTFPTRRDAIAGIVSKHYARRILPADVVAAHDSGDIHYHDLDYSPFTALTNCCLVDVKGMLANGFKMGEAEIEPPKSFQVACAVVSQIIAQVASNQYGGTTIANIDQVLAPYAELSAAKWEKVAVDFDISRKRAFVRKMVNKEIRDGVQSLEYEVNTLYTSNGQTPFVTFTFGMGRCKHACQIQRTILRTRINGLGKNRTTPVFPKLVMFIEDGLNAKPGDPNYEIKELAMICSSRRMYPDIISAELNRQITGSSVPVSPMGCRSFLSVWKDADGNEILDGRNNLGVVSVNLPRIALEAKQKVGQEATPSELESAFVEILYERLAIAKKALDTRIDSLRGIKAKSAPILYMEGAFGVRMDPEDEIIDLFKNGRSSISLGYIGLYEVGQILNWGPKELKHIANFLKLICVGWTKKSPEGFAYSLYSTPSESLCNRFYQLDRERFGVIPDVTDKGWYTNSFHVDVRAGVDVLTKIDTEAPYHRIASGGCISYGEFPLMVNNLKGLESVWDYAMSNLMYYGTNTPTDTCYNCGYHGELNCTEHGFVCPECGNADPVLYNVTRRVCGYLGNPGKRGWNPGKTKEMQNRTKHL